MLSDLAAIDRYIDDHIDETLAELKVLVSQPSISAQGTGIKECAELVGQMLRRRGFAVELVAMAGGNPVVYGEIAGSSEKTMILYNHYDVQPPEPLEEGTS